MNLRLAFRALRATPVVTSVAILSLTFGIGANTAIFSLVDSLVLRTPPVPHPDRLMMVSWREGEVQPVFSYAMFEEMRRLNQFAGVAAWELGGKSNLIYAGTSGIVEHQFVSGTYFPTLGVKPLLGRLLTPADDVAGGGPEGLAAVISYGLWQRRFDGDVRAIGTQAQVDRAVVTIVGVTPRDFLGLEIGRGFDITFPIRGQPLVQPATPLTDTMTWLSATLRLRPNQSVEEATAVLRSAQPAIRAAGGLSTVGHDPRNFFREPLGLVPLASWNTSLRQRFERPLFTILVVVALVLLIASANIANLMLARGEGRMHALSVQTAIGASRWHLARQFLAEAGILTALGTIGALAFGAWASRFIVAQLSSVSAPVVLDPSLDRRVFLFTALVMGVTVVIAGTGPAFRASRIDPIVALTHHGRGGAATSLSNWLVIAQVALSVVLVVGAGLFLRTFKRIVDAPLGMNREQVLVATIMMPTVPAAERNAVDHRLVLAARDVPGVDAAGGSYNPPIAGGMRGDFVVSEPGTKPADNAELIAQSAEVTSGWFAAYGIPIRGGRDFDERDRSDTPPVMIVNESFVRHFLMGNSAPQTSIELNPIGKRIALTFRTPPLDDFLLGTRTIVGIVGDSVYRVIREPLRPTIYLPLAQRTDPLPFTNFYLAVHGSRGSPLGLTRGLAAALDTVQANLAMTFRPLAAEVDDSVAQDRVVALLSGFFGALALLLAALGLYGVTAHAVARRRSEIGIRMALGAAPAGVVKLVLSRVTLLVGTGVLIGSVVSLWASKFVAALLYRVEPRDPATLIAAVMTFAGVAAVAGWPPAWRASRIDPAVVLRDH